MKNQKSVSAISNWYNKYYLVEQKDFTSWYSFMLEELLSEDIKNKKILEIGCGQSKGLRFLKKNNFISERNLFGIDPSSTAIKFSKSKLLKSNLSVGSVYSLKFNPESFDIVFLMEVIEHLEDPKLALKEINKVLKKEGKLFLSFPNYLNFPWFFVRILSEKFNKPNWISLQPIDKIYSIFNIIKYCENNGFEVVKIVGTNYFPPIFYKYEPKNITYLFNKLGFNIFSFHPVLVLKKIK